MKFLMKKLMLSSLSVWLLLGCGSDVATSTTADATAPATSSTLSSDPILEEGVLLDSAVAGAKYDAGEGIEGVTDEQGRFRYLKGERVRFYVHNLFIGEATPVAKGDQQVVTPIELTQSSEVVIQK